MCFDLESSLKAVLLWDDIFSNMGLGWMEDLWAEVTPLSIFCWKAMSFCSLLFFLTMVLVSLSLVFFNTSCLCMLKASYCCNSLTFSLSSYFSCRDISFCLKVSKFSRLLAMFKSIDGKII